MFRTHRERLDADKARYIAKSGRVFERSKKLFSIEELVLPDKSRTSDRNDWVPPLKQIYEQKWGVFLTDLRSKILQFVAESEGAEFDVPWLLITRALDTIARDGNRDADGHPTDLHEDEKTTPRYKLTMAL